MGMVIHTHICSVHTCHHDHASSEDNFCDKDSKKNRLLQLQFTILDHIVLVNNSQKPI